jgi:hypothetical protein
LTSLIEETSFPPLPKLKDAEHAEMTAKTINSWMNIIYFMVVLFLLSSATSTMENQATVKH